MGSEAIASLPGISVSLSLVPCEREHCTKNGDSTVPFLDHKVLKIGKRLSLLIALADNLALKHGLVRCDRSLL